VRICAGGTRRVVNAERAAANRDSVNGWTETTLEWARALGSPPGASTPVDEDKRASSGIRTWVWVGNSTVWTPDR